MACVIRPLICNLTECLRFHCWFPASLASQGQRPMGSIFVLAPIIASSPRPRTNGEQLCESPQVTRAQTLFHSWLLSQVSELIDNAEIRINELTCAHHIIVVSLSEVQLGLSKKEDATSIAFASTPVKSTCSVRQTGSLV